MLTTWEIEQKYQVNDVAQFLARLDALGFELHDSETNHDVYFRHPCRDLRATDEAFRLRKINAEYCVTYKGPRRPGPVKSRPEIELMVAADQADSWLLVLQQLGFVPLPAVIKRRHNYYVPAADKSPWQAALHVTFDEVQSLGNFAELELLVELPATTATPATTSDEPQRADQPADHATPDGTAELDSASQFILQMADQLGLVIPQPRSYLSLLLEQLGIS